MLFQSSVSNRDEVRTLKDLDLLNPDAAMAVRQSLDELNNESEFARLVAISKKLKQIEDEIPRGGPSQKQIAFIQQNPKAGSQFVKEMNSADTGWYYRNELQRLQFRLAKSTSELSAKLLLNKNAKFNSEEFSVQLAKSLRVFNNEFYEVSAEEMSDMQFRFFSSKQVLAVYKCFVLISRVNSSTLQEDQFSILSKAFTQTEASNLMASFDEDAKKDNCCMTNCISCPNSFGLRKKYGK